MSFLRDYEFQVLDLLHDPASQYYSTQQIDSYINEARRQVVRDTACLRSLQQSVCTAGQEVYTFGQVGGAIITSGGSNYTAPTIAFSGGGGSGVAATLGVSGGAITSVTFTSFGSGYTAAPAYVISDATGSGAVLQLGAINVNTADVLGITLTWGGLRYPLGWRAWTEFSALMRGWTTYTRQPALWAVYGDTAFFLGPIPDQSYVMELDTIIMPTPLSDYVTVDPIPTVKQDAIKFYAAYIAKFNAQSYGEAEVFRKQYDRKLIEMTGSYQRRIPEPSGGYSAPERR
jgi:hypothetical protein